MTWKVPAPRTVRTTVYQGLRGVDFTSDPALVDRRRSPEAVNLMGDATGNPEKRPGWRTLATLNDPIDFLGYFRLGEAGFFLLIAGAGLYRWAGDGTAPAFLHTLSAPLVDGECAAFVMGERLWLATGADYLVYDGETVQPVSQIATVPVTAINRPPTGEGGAALQPVNRLTGKRINRFRGDGESTVYQLDNVIAGDAAASAVKPNSVTARRLNADGTWSDLAVSSVDLAAGTVTFSSAPAESPFADRDNVEITYEKAQNELSSVTACRRGVLFGLGGANRIFLTGDPAHPGRDLWSEIHDPAYFPDVNYAQVGSDASPIQGYCRLNGALAVVKAENGQDATVYLRSAAQEESTGGALFPLTQGAAGLGALAPRSFGNLQDEPLFLSPSGVCALVSGDVSALRAVQNRSYYLDGKLLSEPGLATACAAVWQGRYLLSVGGGRVYLLDGRQERSYREGGAAYEGYYWENVPARCLCVREDALFFGTDQGALCRLNTDIDTLERYSDDGAAIACQWATPFDDDGDAARYKTLQRLGCGVVLKPMVRSSCQLSMRTDLVPGRDMRTAELDIFDWEQLRFDRLSFCTSTQPQLVALLTRLRRYGSLQLIARNDAVQEGFGVYAIVKRYTFGPPRKT